MLRTHYRQPIDWTLSGLRESEGVLKRWFRDNLHGAGNGRFPTPEVLQALCDDLNSPLAMTELHSLEGAGHISGLMASLEWLGFNGDLDRPGEIAITDEVWEMVKQRNLARSVKDFRTADRIRDDLSVIGIILQDHPDGTTTPEVKR